MWAYVFESAMLLCHSGKALDVNANGTADGTNVHQWTYNGATTSSG